MASRDYPYLYRDSHGDAVRQHEEDLWEHSFRENVCCARAIEKELNACGQEALAAVSKHQPFLKLFRKSYAVFFFKRGNLFFGSSIREKHFSQPFLLIVVQAGYNLLQLL